MNEKNRIARFATLIDIVENPPNSNIQFVGHMMREWLQGVVADANTRIDTGAGMDSYDLWVTVNGEELFINIKKSRK